MKIVDMDYRAGASNQKAAFTNTIIDSFWARLDIETCRKLQDNGGYYAINAAIGKAIDNHICVLSVQVEHTHKHIANLPKVDIEHETKHRMASFLSKKLMENDGVLVNRLRDYILEREIYSCEIPIISATNQKNKVEAVCRHNNPEPMTCKE